MLLRLRVIHPTLAVVVALALIVAAPRLPIDGRRRRARLGPARASRCSPACRRRSARLNVLLLAPVWLQLVHLLVADLLWIALVLLARRGAGRPRGPRTAYLVSAVGPYIAGTGTSSIRR